MIGDWKLVVKVNGCYGPLAVVSILETTASGDKVYETHLPKPTRSNPRPSLKNPPLRLQHFIFLNVHLIQNL